MKSPCELWNSKNLRFSLPRPAEEREKKGDENLRLRFAFVASAHSRYLTFTYMGSFLPYSCGDSRFLQISLDFLVFSAFRRLRNYLFYPILLKAMHCIGAWNKQIEI